MIPETFLSAVLYSKERQNAFSQLSGDYNPIHDDPVAARRTLVGAQVVHGIHHVLAGMEALLSRCENEAAHQEGIGGFSAYFLKPVLVGETLSFHLAGSPPRETQLLGKIGTEIMCRISIYRGPLASQGDEEFPPPARQSPEDLALDDLRDLRGTLPLELDAGLADESFPRVGKAIGTVHLAEILALSRLVGMHCPGLHSLFSQATVRWDGADGSRTLDYRVDQVDERFGRVSLEVQGPGLTGNLIAFLRPPPEPQPKMAEVSAIVQPGEFTSSIALIVGGSRGLGEVTAKAIAAGGGLPIITYHTGAEDAENVAREIRQGGGRCEALRLDILAEEPIFEMLAERGLRPTTLYYFATPKIGLRRGFFSQEMLTRFCDYYVRGFGNLLEAADQANFKLRVFYPSSIYVEERPRDMMEYVIAKQAGEELCAFYNRYSKNIKVTVERLPRVKTDQTAGLMVLPGENGLTVMLPLIRELEKA